MKVCCVPLVPLLLALGIACDADPPSPDGALGGASSAIWPPLDPPEEGGVAEDNPWLHPQTSSGGLAASGEPLKATSGGAGAGSSTQTQGGKPQGLAEPPSPTGGKTGDGEPETDPQPADLRIARYIETATSEKQLWLQNRGRMTQEGECEVVISSNGSTKPYRRHLLPALAAEAEFRLCTAEVPVACEGSLGSSSFNGNDAIVVTCAGGTVDSFGRLGEDPGKAWLGGGLSSTDADLLRCSAEPDVVPTDPFVINDAWVSAAATATWSEAFRGCEQKSLGGSGSN